MDYADGNLILVLKDEDGWNDEQIQSAREAFKVEVCETAGLLIFLAEGGPLDTCDFYFNIQDCDEKEALLASEFLNVKLVLLNPDNTIAVIKNRTLNRQQTQQVLELMKRQNEMQFMPGEYECNLEGILNTYEPPELAKFAKVEFELKD